MFTWELQNYRAASVRFVTVQTVRTWSWLKLFTAWYISYLDEVGTTFYKRNDEASIDLR